LPVKGPSGFRSMHSAPLDEIGAALALGVAVDSLKKTALLQGCSACVFSPVATRAQRHEIVEQLCDPSTAWCTASRSMAPQLTQRFPSRSRAARLSFCHAKRSSSGREEPGRWGLLQALHVPLVSAERIAPHFEQTWAKAIPFHSPKTISNRRPKPKILAVTDISEAYGSVWTGQARLQSRSRPERRAHAPS
jgi:hypothetical protein